MKHIPFPGKEMSPILQLLALVGYAIAGAFVFGVLAILIVVMIYGTSFFGDIMSGVPTARNADGFKILLFLSTSVGTFLVPSLALAWTEKIPVTRFYGLKKPGFALLGLVLIATLVCTPIMEWVIQLNQRIDLPESMKGLESWMRKAEADAMRTTYMILDIRNWWDLPVNLLVVAIAPAVAEEFMFRGGLQRTFGRLLLNPHVTIWFTAAVFSAIHMQFLGFFPRMFLGAGLGYLYLWTGSLWYPIFAHFVNNAFSVIVAFYYSSKNIPLERAAADSSNFHWSIYILSIILTAATLTAIYNFTKKEEDDRQLDQNIHDRE